MSVFIYCLYSDEDGCPRYIGHTDGEVDYQLKQHITAALEMEPGPLYDWIRDVWRRGHDIGVFTLQEGVIPEDRTMFEQYWIDQFEGLLNATSSGDKKTNTATAKQVISAIRAQLNRSHR